MHQVVVVAGVVGGIGSAIASAARARGYLVVGIDRDSLGLGTFVEGGGLAIAGDVANPETHERAASLAVQEGTLVGWVNAAGIAIEGRIDQVGLDDYRTLIDINFGGTLWGISIATREMLKSGGGSIVSLSSTQAQRGLAGYPLYAASKGAIDALTRQVAAEFAPLGIRCNAIAPGVIATPMNRKILADAEDPAALSATWDAMCPIGRWGEPSDVAALACYLLGDDSGFMTGQVLTIDGGQTIAPLTVPNVAR